MNKAILMGRLTSDPQVRYTQQGEPLCIARYSLAVPHRFKRDGEADADFINCVAFGKAGEFAEKYFRKGMRVGVSGRIQTGSYTDKDGKKVYTTEVVIEEQDFADSKGDSSYSGANNAAPPPPSNTKEEFMDVPEGMDDELPFG